MNPPGRFLIVTWDGGGNTPPALNLAERLIGLGHHVRILGWESMGARSKATGAEFTTYPSVEPWPQGEAMDDAWEDRVVPMLQGSATRDDIVAEAGRMQPDVIVVDCMMGAGLDAARALGLPAAVLVHLPYAAFVFEWRDHAGRAEMLCVLDDFDAVLALVPPGFDTACPLPANTSYVGPINAPPPRPALDPVDAELLAEPGDPWVLLSLGTTVQGQARALPTMLEAVATRRVRVLLTLGGVLPPSTVDAPPNVVVRAFVPHDLVMAHMSAVVSHGGLSTIGAALTAGVPILCIPQGRDQPDNAARVATAGVGHVVPPDASAAEIAAALDRLLGDADTRRAARRMSEVIAGLGGGEVATQRVVDLLTVRPRVTRCAAPAPDLEPPAAQERRRPGSPGSAPPIPPRRA